MNRDQLNDAIHDRWFDAERVSLIDPQTLVIPFNSQHTWKPKPDSSNYDKELVIESVKSFQVTDEAEIRYYQFDEILYDEATSSVAITSSFPIKIDVVVETFEVSIRPAGGE
jgi:hypothetical protein